MTRPLPPRGGGVPIPTTWASPSSPHWRFSITATGRTTPRFPGPSPTSRARCRPRAPYPEEWSATYLVDNYTTALGLMVFMAADAYKRHGRLYLADFRCCGLPDRHPEHLREHSHPQPGSSGLRGLELRPARLDRLVGFGGSFKLPVEHAGPSRGEGPGGRGPTAADIDTALDAALTFTQRCQNRPASNDLPWAPRHGQHLSRGTAGSSTTPIPPSRDPFYPESYDTMTYAGIWGLYSCGVALDDPRVTDAVGLAFRQFHGGSPVAGWIHPLLHLLQHVQGPGRPGGREPTRWTPTGSAASSSS